jgi:hypothetical protein
MTEGRGNAVREDDELELEDEGEELSRLRVEGGDEPREDTAPHDYPDNEPLSVTHQAYPRALGLGDYHGSQETSADGDSDYPPRPSRRIDDTGSIPDDSPSVQVRLSI